MQRQTAHADQVHPVPGWHRAADLQTRQREDMLRDRMSDRELRLQQTVMWETAHDTVGRRHPRRAPLKPMQTGGEVSTALYSSAQLPAGGTVSALHLCYH